MTKLQDRLEELGAQVLSQQMTTTKQLTYFAGLISKDIEANMPILMHSESTEMLKNGWFDSEYIAYNKGVSDFMKALKQYSGGQE